MSFFYEKKKQLSESKNEEIEIVELDEKPQNQCMISKLFSDPESWRPYLKNIPPILYRFKPSSSLHYIVGCAEEICKSGKPKDLQILGIHVLVFVREVQEAICDECDQLTFLLAIPFFYKRCLVFEEMPYVRGMESRFQNEWINETSRVVLSKNLPRMLMDGVCEEYREMVARDIILDTGLFSGFKTRYPTVDELLTMNSPIFSASVIESNRDVIEKKILARLEFIQEKLDPITSAKKHRDIHLSMILWLNSCLWKLVPLDKDPYSLEPLVSGLRMGFSLHVKKTKEKIAKLSGNNSPVTAPKSFAADLSLIDQPDLQEVLVKLNEELRDLVLAIVDHYLV